MNKKGRRSIVRRITVRVYKATSPTIDRTRKIRVRGVTSSKAIKKNREKQDNRGNNKLIIMNPREKTGRERRTNRRKRRGTRKRWRQRFVGEGRIASKPIRNR